MPRATRLRGSAGQKPEALALAQLPELVLVGLGKVGLHSLGEGRCRRVAKQADHPLPVI